MAINPALVQIAAAVITRQKRAAAKVAFQPPQDPAAAGGAPPGGPPPDPSMGGGAPPMDPAAAGGAPPPDAGGGGGPGLDMVLQKLDQLTQAIAGGGMAGGAGRGAGGPGGKLGRPDPAAQGMDIFQMKKVLFAIANAMGVEIPPEVLDGPNRDPASGMPMPPGAPGSTSDPNVMAQQGGSAGGGDAGGGNSAIPPIQPIQPATPAGPGGGGKTAGAMGEPFNGGGIVMGIDVPPPTTVAGKDMQNKAAALAALLRGRK
jgi:hypothetical protein